MSKSIGLIEFNSIAKGIEVADTMLKAADVELIIAKPICPGKYIVLVSGEVAAVKASIEAGEEISKQFLINSLVLANIDEQIFKGIHGTTELENPGALGVLEFFSIASAIEATDRAVKATQIEVIEIRLGFAIGGKSFVTFTGDVSSTEEAVEIAAKVGMEDGMLLNKAFIPSPRKEIFDNLL